ncbi:hypothetical protein ALI22I_20315 [Saccharothrix sp. ALI-22-I]|uniref:hypothetical protein n=1 Tax=Saccharothrix sp. ALI-22-I TaxID=1933778 RepID=UPI00097C1997|nr:hypothetical protein [Saccharothrix sp. ALI-22-I]ONI88085.1 hypothetical protein ALI22I_20315 [Saccharothrix sp. ALI-22-I]
MHSTRQQDYTPALSLELTTAAVLEHADLCAATAAAVIRTIYPSAATVDVLLPQVWDFRDQGLDLDAVHDATGRRLQNDHADEWINARTEAALHIANALRFADPELLDWTPVDASPDQDADGHLFRLALPPEDQRPTKTSEEFDPAADFAWRRSFTPSMLYRFGQAVTESPYVNRTERYLVVFAATFDETTPDVTVTGPHDAAAATLDLIRSSEDGDGKIAWMVLDRDDNLLDWLEQRRFQGLDISSDRDNYEQDSDDRHEFPDDEEPDDGRFTDRADDTHPDDRGDHPVKDHTVSDVLTPDDVTITVNHPNDAGTALQDFHES